MSKSVIEFDIVILDIAFYENSFNENKVLFIFFEHLVQLYDRRKTKTVMISIKLSYDDSNVHYTDNNNSSLHLHQTSYSYKMQMANIDL